MDLHPHRTYALAHLAPEMLRAADALSTLADAVESYATLGDGPSWQSPGRDQAVRALSLLTGFVGRVASEAEGTPPGQLDLIGPLLGVLAARRERRRAPGRCRCAPCAD